MPISGVRRGVRGAGSDGFYRRDRAAIENSVFVRMGF